MAEGRCGGDWGWLNIGQASDILIQISLSKFINLLHIIFIFHQDYYTEGRTQPLPDDSQDYQLVYASEIGGYTELMFQRPRDTSDNEDIKFEVRLNIYVFESLVQSLRRNEQSGLYDWAIVNIPGGLAI